MSTHRYRCPSAFEMTTLALEQYVPSTVSTVSGANAYVDVTLVNDADLPLLNDIMAARNCTFFATNPGPQQAGPLPWVYPTTIPVIAGPYTASSGERVPYDGAVLVGFTINAPAAPSLGDRFGVKNIGLGVTVMTLDGNGSNIENPLLSVLGGSFTAGVSLFGAAWEYMNGVWHVVT